MLKKKIWANFKELLKFLPKKKLNMLSNIWGLGSGIRDPESGIWKKPIPDPGVKKAPDPGSRIPDPQH